MIKGCVSQNQQCQKALFNTYAGKFMTVCIRYARDEMEAEDFLQEGFVRIFNNLHQFKFEGSFEGWMRRVVVNVCLKKLQKKNLHFVELVDYSSQMPNVNSTAVTNLGEDDLMRLIQKLPEGYKIVFNLNIIEGYSHEEIADMLQIQASTSRSQLVKARKMLQTQILELQKIAV